MRKSDFRQIALILGMHRSGTSALAGLVSRLGFSAGKKVLPANEFNPKGYYESEALVNFHADKLVRLGSSWHDLRILPDSAFEADWFSDAAQQLASILTEGFDNDRRIVVKDPRSIRLLPIWLRFASEHNVKLRFLLIGRHPLQVAYSLAHRDQFSRNKSLLLWLQHNLLAERATRSEPRLILRYRDLMSDPLRQARAVATFLEVKAEKKIKSAAAAIDASHAHHSVESEIVCDNADLQHWTREVWQLLFQRSLKDKRALEKLDRIFEEVRERLSILPQEANGQGEYEAVTWKRRYETKSQALQSVTQQREDARRKADSIEQEHKFLKERYQERAQLLHAVMLHRDEARKRAEAAAAEVERIERESKALKERYQQQNEALEKVMQQRAEVRKEAAEARKEAAAEVRRIEQEYESLKERYREQNAALEQVMQQRDEVTREQAAQLRAAVQTESKLRGEIEAVTARMRTLEISDEMRRQLQEVLRATAEGITARESQAKGLLQKLENLRHDWVALPVRKELKKLAGPFAGASSDLIQLNGVTPSIWNQSRGGYRFGVSIFPDLENVGGALIEGWLLPRDKATPLPAVRLVSEIGSRRKAKTGRERVDVPLLFKADTRAKKSGFAFLNLKGIGAERWRMEVRKPDAEWIALGFVDFSGIGGQHLRDIHAIAVSRLFGFSWYSRRYRLTELSQPALIAHYLREGAARGYLPNPLFDTAYYLESNPEVAATGENPLLHYLRTAREGSPRQPNPWFEPLWYLQRNKDVTDTGLDPLAHYLTREKHDRRNPGPRFDVASYLKANPDVERAPLDPLAHYIHYGSAEGREATRPEDVIKWIHETALPADDRKLNILLVGHVLGDKMFGSERSLLELVQLIDRTRFNIFCTFPQAAGLLLQSIKPLVAGVATFPYKWWSGDAGATDGFERQFETIMRTRGIDLVHVNSIVLRDPLIAARRLGIPSVLHLREIITLDPDLAERIGLPAEQIASEVAERSDFMIANSYFTQTQQGKPGRSFVLYNTADETALDLSQRKPAGQLRVAMLSSNLRKKGLDDFFTIARRAQEQNDPLEFWLVGPETEWIRRHFQSSDGCPSNVRCTGYIEDPATILQDIDVILNLSTFAESFGRSVAEGMFARRPAVVYEHGALPELIRDGVDGFVVPFRDTESVLERLNRLALDRALLTQMGESARIRAVAKFSRDVGAETLNRIYDTILKDSSAENRNGESMRRLPQPVEVVTDAKKMRIGYFMWHFPVPSETFVLNELRDFVRLRHDVVVFCKESPHKEFQPDFPIEWHRVKSPEELAQKMKETGREIMHSHFVFPTVTQFLWPACEIAQIPFTFIAHAVDIFRYENAAKNRLAEIAQSPLCRRIFAPGTFHRDFFIESGVPAGKIIISAQGIFFDAYEAQPIAARLRQPRMSVCAIHRFIEKKGLHDAIRAAQELAPHGISLHLYGYGPLEESYRELVTEMGLGNVFFPGPVRDRNHMIEVFREHDLFLCPSVRAADGDMDGIPTILLEAMASHVPVVASRVSSIPDLVVDGLTGYLTEPGDVASLTEAIVRFYEEPVAQVQAMIENARERVRKRFDVMKSNRTLLRTWAGEGLDVILVTFNATEEVREVIERLYRFTKTAFQLYIVDNGSEQETLDYLRSVAAAHDNVRLLPQEKNLFVGPGTNTGIEAGTAPIAAYLCSREGYVLAEGWDQHILNFMADNPAVGLAGTLGYSPSYFTGADYIDRLEPFPKFRSPDFAAQNRERVFRHVQGGMFAMRRSMYEAIGGFSEAVPHNHTDVEYSYYVESRGWELGQIPEFVIVYQKSRPLLTARLTESTDAVHPGSRALTPLLNAVICLETNLCNVCSNAVSFAESAEGESVCPVCGATPFQRSLYRLLAESNLTYRQLVTLYVGESDGLPADWPKMFRGRTLDYAGLLAELAAKGRIDHTSARFDLIVLRIPDATGNPSSDLFREIARVLKPEGRLLYSQPYGSRTILDSSLNGEELFSADEIGAFLESKRFHIHQRVRYASAAVRYSNHEIFVCGESLPK